jgi:hypothetical protein
VTSSTAPSAIRSASSTAVLDGAERDGDVSSEKEFAGRVFAEPAKNSGVDALKGIGVGVAGMYGDANKADNLSSLVYRTPRRGRPTSSSTPRAP